jgi:cytochrome c oxidase assembly protein subunit 11
MTMPLGNPPRENKPKGRSNIGVFVACLTFVGTMVGMSYAAVPLYRLYCQVSGYNGTTMRVEQQSSTILDRKMRVEFDTNSDPSLEWQFAPVQRNVDVRIGETVQVMFKATNRSSETETGQAVFNVTPMVAGAYFNKVECFCFTNVTLKAGETKEMPVVFFIDPEIVKPIETKGIKTITLSYTFYPHAPDQPVAEVDRKNKTADNKL